MASFDHRLGNISSEDLAKIASSSEFSLETQKEAMAELHHRHQKPTETYIKHFVESRYSYLPDIEQIALDSILSAIKYCGNHDIESFQGLVNTIAGRAALKETYRNMKILTGCEGEAAIENSHMEQDGIQIKQDWDHVEQNWMPDNAECAALKIALGMLPESDRDIFLRKRIFDESYKTIAELYQISASAVDSRLRRIEKRLRQLAAQQHQDTL